MILSSARHCRLETVMEYLKQTENIEQGRSTEINHPARFPFCLEISTYKGK